MTLADGRSGLFPILTTSHGATEQPATITAELSLPSSGGRVPAVIVLHSCAGVTPSIGAWARALTRLGYAALVVDSFGGRAVKEVCTGKSSVSIGSRLADLFRAHELLVTHPRIDAQRVGVLGFSQGGWAVLWASHSQYQRRFMRGTAPPPSAYAAFYPAGCNVQLIKETDVTAPVRIFHGSADDWTTIEHCRDWVARRRQADQDVALVEYEGARHGFDVASYVRPRHYAQVVNSSMCTLIQQPNGMFVDGAGRPFSGASPCMKVGGSMGYDAGAHQRAMADLHGFFQQAFGFRR